MADTQKKLLTMDIGNSTTKLGLFVDGRLEMTDTLPTGGREEMAFQVQELGQALAPALGEHIQGIIVSSVVPAVRPLFEPILTQALSPDAVLWLAREEMAGIHTGPVNLAAYAPGQLGTDRIANIVGAADGFPNQLALVCDFGTTATFDMVDETGLYIGGAICPGPRNFQSLIAPRHAAQLFEVDVFQKPTQTPGQSTQASLENGMYYGYKGMILEIVGNLLQSAGWPLSQVKIILAGGYAAYIKDMVAFEMPPLFVDPGITLKGLHHIWQYNRVATPPIISLH